MQGWKQSPHSQAFVCQQTSGAKTGFFSHRRTRPPKKRSQTKTDIQILNKNSNFWNEEFFGMSSYHANCLSLPCVFVDLGVHTRYGRLRASTHGMHKVLQLFDSEQHHDWQQAHDAVETLFGWKLAKIKAKWNMLLDQNQNKANRNRPFFGWIFGADWPIGATSSFDARVKSSSDGDARG